MKALWTEKRQIKVLNDFRISDGHRLFQGKKKKKGRLRNFFFNDIMEI